MTSFQSFDDSYNPSYPLPSHIPRSGMVSRRWPLRLDVVARDMCWTGWTDVLVWIELCVPSEGLVRTEKWVLSAVVVDSPKDPGSRLISAVSSLSGSRLNAATKTAEDEQDDCGDQNKSDDGAGTERRPHDSYASIQLSCLERADHCSMLEESWTWALPMKCCTRCKWRRQPSCTYSSAMATSHDRGCVHCAW